MNKGEPVGGPKRQRAGRMHANRRSNRLTRSVKGPELSDDDNFVLKDDDGGRQIVLPRRSDIIGDLPKGSAIIPKRSDIALNLLGAERYRLVEAIKVVDENLRIIDSNGKWVHLYMDTEEPSSNCLTSKTASTRNIAAAGYVRDQGDHPLCWDFCVCDLVSASAVLHGHMENYKPLSQKFLCQEVDKEQYVERVVVVEGEDQTHKCYMSEMFRALKHVKKSQGIPRANKEERSKDFDCNVERQFRKDEKRFAIRDVYRYDKLEDALWRLEVHPVAATLILFEGWEEKGVYVGPRGNAKYLGGHAVLMLSCVKHDSGKMVVRCKSSNGKAVANDGYIDVSLDVMVIVVAGTREDGEVTCLKNPTHLLCDFYSIDMDLAPNGAQTDEDETRKKKNSRFKVNFGK